MASGDPFAPTIDILDIIPKRVSRKKKTHGLADAAGLTSAEIARRDLEAKEKTERAQTAAALRSAKAKGGKSGVTYSADDSYAP